MMKGILWTKNWQILIDGQVVKTISGGLPFQESDMGVLACLEPEGPTNLKEDGNHAPRCAIKWHENKI